MSSLAKITGPPSSPGPEVLLGNKSPLRRSRFPAWGHHFQDGDDCWISLIISFPFEVMLKEVVIHMHGNYLIGKLLLSVVFVDVFVDVVVLSHSSYSLFETNILLPGLLFGSLLMY